MTIQMKFSIDDQYEFDYEEECEVFRGISPKMLALFMEDEKNRENKVAPDTIGADKFFIDGFVTEAMESDFWIVARDFLRHHFPRLKEFHDLAIYGNDKPQQSDPANAMQNKVLNLMYNAAKSGDAYSVELMKNLYKTYHKKEYKQLKRFHRISVSEIFSLAEIEDSGCSNLTIARILGMCQFYGIKLDEQCSLLYLMLNKARKEWDMENERDFFCFPEGLYQECYAQVEAWMGQCENKKKFRSDLDTYWKADRFAEICLKRHGYPEDYLYRCNLEFWGLERLMALTLAVLKCAHPKEKFTFEEVQTYAMIAQSIDAAVSASDIYDENLTEMLGIEAEMNRFTECQFKPENIIFYDTPKTAKGMKPVHIAPVASENIKQEDYLKEIEELRRRLREKEEECKYFRQQYEHAKGSLSDAREVIAQNESNREELIALRNYVYGLSREEPPMEEDRFEDMKRTIGKKNIMIIGGHINWINKLKKEFPDWRYMDANISRANDSKLVEGAEKVYFFTDHLSHSTYGKFIKILRESGISFGYINSVNMEILVRQVFEDS